jgi:hypothetical protein
MKQTAVEWLVEQMKTWGDLPRWQRDDIIEQAKQMEKEQIIEAIQDTEVFIRGLYNDGDAEQYYNETFKSK